MTAPAFIQRTARILFPTRPFRKHYRRRLKAIPSHPQANCKPSTWEAVATLMRPSSPPQATSKPEECEECPPDRSGIGGTNFRCRLWPSSRQMCFLTVGMEFVLVHPSVAHRRLFHAREAALPISPAQTDRKSVVEGKNLEHG